MEYAADILIKPVSRAELLRCVDAVRQARDSNTAPPTLRSNMKVVLGS
jgi:hypothetical protein